MINGRIFVIVFVIVGLIAAAASTWVMIGSYGVARENQAGIGPRMVHQAAQVWADEHDGAYPHHLALLRRSNFFQRDMLLDPRRFDDGEWIVGGLDVRSWMDASHDSSPAALAGRAAFEKVIAEASAEPYYQLGDYHFVRLDRPTGSGAVVFAWTRADEGGRRFVVFDDGGARRIDPGDWTSVWEADARARAELNLPALDAPPL